MFAKRVFYCALTSLALLTPMLQAQEVEVLNPTFLGNWERNYYGEEAPDNLDLVWKHYLGEGVTVIGRKAGSREWKGAGWTGQPLMVREGNDTFLIQGAYDHQLKKINARDGALVWQYKYDDVIKGTGTIWENRFEEDSSKRWVILQGSRLGVEHFLDAPKVYSFRAISYMTGQELWRHNSKLTKSYSRDVDASALIYNDTAYIGLENSYFTVFNPNPDSAWKNGAYKCPLIYNQQILYTQEDVKSHRSNPNALSNVVTESSPCRIGRMIYVTSGSGHVWGYDIDKGELTWDFFVGSDMDGSPVVTYDNCILVTIEKQYIGGKGGMLKLDPSKGAADAVRWFLPVQDTTYASWEGGVIGSAGVSDSYNEAHLAACMAIDGYLYVVKHDELSGEKVVGFDGKTLYPSPRLVYKKKIGASISSPLFTEDRLVTCGYGGVRLFSYNEEDEFKQLDMKPYYAESTPFIFGGRVYIASRNGYLYCLGRND